MSAPDRADAFVSYRHREPTQTWVRETLVPALVAADLEVILDVHDFVFGDNLVEQIERSAERARVTVAVVDELYEKSGFTEAEKNLSNSLLVVQRGDVERLPPATHQVDLRATDDPSEVVDVVHELVKRVFILESEEQEPWVTGFLLPALWRADVDARHIGDLTAGHLKDTAIDAAIERADRVIVVVSATYLQQMHHGAGARLAQWEAEHNVDKSIPVVYREDEHALELPLRYRKDLMIDVSDRKLWTDALVRICEALDVRPPRLDQAPECPYPGMRPYREGGNHPFHGRDREIDGVIDQLEKRGVAAVIGPSGSGKSSLVLAGVVPRLRERGMHGRPDTNIEVVRPTDELSSATARLGEHNSLTTRVLIVDQLEQALPSIHGTATTDDPGRQFLASIVEHRRTDPHLAVIVTVRADFYEQLMTSPIWPLVELDLLPIAPLAGDALKDAIRLPARALGVEYHEPLLIELAHETEGQPGLMPFLQETLRRLWGRQPWWYLSLSTAEYRDGEFSVAEAIRRQADDALKIIRRERPGDGEQIARGILMRLVHFGEGGLSTRRQLEVSKIIDESPDPIATRQIFEVLSDSQQRIITIDDREIDDDDGVEHVQVADLSHDAIISGWPVFREWIDNDVGVEMERRRWLQRVDGELLAGRDLAAAEDWLERAETSRSVVEPSLVEYVTRSRIEADRMAEQDRRAAERKRRWLLIGLTVSAIAAVTLAVLSIVALRARNDARSAQRTAEAETDRRVATQLQTSASAYEGGLGLPSLLVRAADLIDPTNLSAVEMLATVERNADIVRRIDATERNVGFEAAVVLADGRVVIGDGFGGLDVWDVGGTEPAAHVELGHIVFAIAAHDDGDLLAVVGGNVEPDELGFAGRDGWIDFIDANDATLATRRVRLASDSPISTALFDGDRLIVGAWDGTIAVIDVSVPSNPAIERTIAVPDLPADADCRIDGTDRKVRSLAVDAGGRWLAAGANHCVIAIWDRTDLSVATTLIAHTSKVRAVTFVPDSVELLSTGDDATIRSWDLSGPMPDAVTLVGATGDGTAGDEVDTSQARVVTMCVAPNGESVVTAGRDHVVRRWSREGGALSDPVEYSSHVTTVRQVTCPTDTTFTSVAGDGMVTWDISQPNRWAEQIVAADDDRGILDVEVRPDDSGQVAVAVGGELHVVDAEGGIRTPERADGTGDVESLSYSDDGVLLAVIAEGVSGFADQLVVYDAASLAIVEAWSSTGNGELTGVSIVDIDNVAAGMNDDEILLVRDGMRDDQASPTGRRVSALALAPDGRIVVGDIGGTLMCASTSDLGTVGFIELGRSVNDIDLAEDGTVALGTSDGQIRSFPRVLGDEQNACDPTTWTGVSPPITHTAIRSVAQTSDGELLIAATSSGTIEVWDIPRLRLIGELTVGAGVTVGSVSIHPSAEVLAAGGSAGALRFDIDRDGLRQRLCEVASRNLTSDEEAAFLPIERYRELARCFG